MRCFLLHFLTRFVHGEWEFGVGQDSKTSLGHVGPLPFHVQLVLSSLTRNPAETQEFNEKLAEAKESTWGSTREQLTWRVSDLLDNWMERGNRLGFPYTSSILRAYLTILHLLSRIQNQFLSALQSCLGSAWVVFS